MCDAGFSNFIRILCNHLPPPHFLIVEKKKLGNTKNKHLTYI
mgnify:CR=1 FL=1